MLRLADGQANRRQGWRRDARKQGAKLFERVGMQRVEKGIHRGDGSIGLDEYQENTMTLSGVLPALVRVIL
jgi:hypothetical protein